MVFKKKDATVDSFDLCCTAGANSKNPNKVSDLLSRHPPGSARFHEILEQLGELHDKKQADYGTGTDPFANVRASAEWGVRPWVGALIRLNDKVHRLQSFVRNGHLKNEGVDDSLRDIAVYAIIGLVLFEQEQESSGRAT